MKEGREDLVERVKYQFHPEKQANNSWNIDINHTREATTLNCLNHTNRQ
jgi:hypothetical protein